MAQGAEGGAGLLLGARGDVRLRPGVLLSIHMMITVIHIKYEHVIIIIATIIIIIIIIIDIIIIIINMLLSLIIRILIILTTQHIIRCPWPWLTSTPAGCSTGAKIDKQDIT